MTLSEVFVYVVLVLGVVFLLCGLIMLFLGTKKHSPSSKLPRIEIKIGSSAFSAPYTASIVACVVGVVLLLLAYNVVTQGGVPEQPSSSVWISSAHAQTDGRESDVPRGWVYFGNEGSPKQWNFEILGGGYRELYEQKAGVVLKALRPVNVRENHFGSFTGTVLGFLSPEPRVLGTMPTGTCAVPEEIVSVGFRKIWVKVKPVSCPQ